MKGIFKGFLLISIAILMLCNIAYAIPMIYTFEGTIQGFGNGAGSQGLGIGSSISYTILVDLDRAGTYTTNNGTVVTVPNGQWFGNPITSFYAEYLSGSALQEVNGGIHNSLSDVFSYNYGLWGRGPNVEGDLFLGSDDSYIQIMGNCGTLFPYWQIGTTSTLQNWAYDSNGNSSLVVSYDLTLASITPAHTPEPSTLVLLGVGIAGVAARMRRIHRRKLLLS